MLMRVASAALACSLLVGVPLSTSAVEKSAVTANLETRVTVADFLDYTLTAITYQHGSEAMQSEILSAWVKEGELQNQQAYVTQDQIATVLVRAIGKEQQVVGNYNEAAKKLGLFDGIATDKQISSKDLEIIFENYKKVVNKDVNGQGVKEISVEDFMSNPGNFGYQLSPDGNYISYASAWESRSNVFVKEMNSEKEPVRVTSSTDRDIAGFIWKDDNILYLKDNAGDENYHIYSSSFSGAKEQDLTPYPNVVAYPVDILHGVEDHILIMMNKEDATAFDLYKLNVKTGKTTLVAKNPGNIQGWLADNNGQIRMALESDGVVGTVLYRDSEDEPFRPFIKLEAGDTVTPIAFSKDNQSVYAYFKQRSR